MPHLKYWLNMVSDALGHQEDEESIFKYIDQKEYSVRMDNIKCQSKPTTSELNIYTDGSKIKLGAGSGFVIIKNKNQVIYTQSINLPSLATIFQAELIAIREACSYVMKNFHAPKYKKYSATHKRP